MRLSRLLPSGGFLLLLASWLSLLAFFAWGFSRPTLAAVWELIEKMQERDFAGLTTAEIDLLRAEMERHPALVVELAGKDRVGLVEATQGGWSALPLTHLILHGEPTTIRRFWVSCRAHDKAFPISVSIEGAGLSETLNFEGNGRKFFDLAPGRLLSPAVARVQVSAALPAAPEARPFELKIESEALSVDKEAP